MHIFSFSLSLSLSLPFNLTVLLILDYHSVSIINTDCFFIDLLEISPELYDSIKITSLVQW